MIVLFITVCDISSSEGMLITVYTHIWTAFSHFYKDDILDTHALQQQPSINVTVKLFTYVDNVNSQVGSFCHCLNIILEL